MTETAYRTTFIDGDYRREPKTEVFCARCQKDLKPGQKRRGVHIVDGGAMVLHPDDEAIYNALPAEAKRGDCGCWLVGMDCARQIGMEWTFAVEANEPMTGEAK